MAGLEVAGVCLGVLPILLEAVKAYSSVCRSLRVFRHYSWEINSIEKQFDIRQGIFRNECCLLLCLIGDDRSAKEMLDNDGDERWHDSDFDARLSRVLDDNVHICRLAIEASKEAIDDLQEELDKFDVIVEGKNEGETIRSAIRRLRHATRIALDKPKYERSLSKLREHNADLTQLREHIGEFQQRKVYTITDSLACEKSKARIDTIRTASVKLHEALSTAWCCDDSSHAGHSAKLCLDAQVEDEVRLELAISCQQKVDKQQQSSLFSEVPIWLHVQTASIDTTRSQPEPARLGSKSTKKRLQYDEAVIDSKVQLSKARSITKRRATLSASTSMTERSERVGGGDDAICFEDNYATKIRSAIAENITSSTAYINLRQENICRFLKQNTRLCEGTSSRCLGYLESANTFRHVFYLQERYVASIPSKLASGRGPLFSVSDLLGQCEEETLTIVDQLKLAHKAALAVLQFNATPWLARNWRLRDIGYFGMHNAIDEEALKTLHLTSRLSPLSLANDVEMESVQEVGHAASEEDLYGINNATLFFLGVALLELAHWKPLESMRTEQDPHEILTARRLAARPTPLGPKYQDIARKCLRCQFKYGPDLTTKDLQSEVYSDVVVPLEKMIEALTI